MTHLVLAEVTASISELKKNPLATALAGEGAPVAILNRNEPVMYCVPAKTFERMMERLDDLGLNRVADLRRKDGRASIRVTLDELRACPPSRRVGGVAKAGGLHPYPVQEEACRATERTPHPSGQAVRPPGSLKDQAACGWLTAGLRGTGWGGYCHRAGNRTKEQAGDLPHGWLAVVWSILNLPTCAAIATEYFRN